MRRIVFLGFLLCTGCGLTHEASPPPVAAAPATPQICHIGPNDGPALAERGIGGTGMPLFNATSPASGALPASPAGQGRGVGGTGAPALPGAVKQATGNTGIVGEITGFASVCLNGVEVAYDPATQFNIDGQAESPTALRAGQIAAITATPDKAARDGLRASLVSIRHEVSGPVASATGERLVVAGQPVSWTDQTRGLQHVGQGDWIAVSGFRNNAGIIVATRIDPRPPGPVTVHGTVARLNGGTWIGTLRLNMPLLSRRLHNGEAVTATGRLDGAVLDVDNITPDLLYSDPQAYFGPNVERILMQSYAYTLGGAIHIALGTSIGLLKGVLPFQQSGLTIWSLVRLPGGTLQAMGQFLGAVGSGENPFAGAPPPP